MLSIKDKNILVLYTGGTIGMVPTKNGYDVKKGHLVDVIKSMGSFNSSSVPNFEIKEYDNLIDSSNIHPHSWLEVANDIINSYKTYDGFVVLHGTDTLAYSSSALSFILGDIDKPVIVTGSQIPISQPRSDAPSNILDSLIMACDDSLKEVCVCFNRKLMRGNRVTKIDASGFDAFISPNYPLLGSAGINIDLDYDKTLKREPLSELPSLAKLSNYKPRISVFSIFPGVDYKVLDIILNSQPIDGLILKTYGAGNIPNDSNIYKTLKAATDNSVTILNCSQCAYGSVDMGAYKSSNILIDAGVLSGYDMTDEAALAKMFYILSLNNIKKENIKDLFTRDLQGEFTI